MAAATITKTSYGYNLTGGTSATLVTTGRIKLNKITTDAATANDTAIYGDAPVGRASAQFLIHTGVTAHLPVESLFDGTWVDGLTVTLSATGVKADIYVY